MPPASTGLPPDLCAEGSLERADTSGDEDYDMKRLRYLRTQKPSQLSEIERREKMRLQNRESARKLRKRRVAQLEGLQEELQRLQKENDALVTRLSQVGEKYRSMEKEVLLLRLENQRLQHAALPRYQVANISPHPEALHPAAPSYPHSPRDTDPLRDTHPQLHLRPKPPHAAPPFPPTNLHTHLHTTESTHDTYYAATSPTPTPLDYPAHQPHSPHLARTSSHPLTHPHHSPATSALNAYAMDISAPLLSAPIMTAALDNPLTASSTHLPLPSSDPILPGASIHHLPSLTSAASSAHPLEAAASGSYQVVTSTGLPEAEQLPYHHQPPSARPPSHSAPMRLSLHPPFPTASQPPSLRPTSTPRLAHMGSAPPRLLAAPASTDPPATEILHELLAAWRTPSDSFGSHPRHS